MLIVWDEPRRLANLVKHRMDFAEFENSFGFESLKAFFGQGRARGERALSPGRGVERPDRGRRHRASARVGGDVPGEPEARFEEGKTSL